MANTLIPGPPGESAYAVALRQGFIGTESQWLDSLTGKPGEPSPSGLIIGEGPPQQNVGLNGQLYFDAEVPSLYGPKTLGSWGTPTLLIRLITGAGAPAAGLGRHGQYYLDTVSKALYGPKIATNWGAPALLSPLIVGSGAPVKLLGANGQIYIDQVALKFYGPKANDDWPAGIPIIGPARLSALTPWQSGTAYVTGPPASFVSQGGSSYVCLVNHTAGSSFATDLAGGKWGVVAAKGVDGQVTSVAGLTGAISAAALTAALLAFVGDTGAGGGKGLVPAPAAGDAAAGKVLGAGGVWVTQAGSGATASAPLDDFRTLAIQLAKVKGSIVLLAGGVADDFRDQTGYDTANSINASYDGTSNTISNVGAAASEELAPMTSNSAPAGQSASASTSAGSPTYDAYRAYDGVASSAWAATAATGSIQRTTASARTEAAYAISPDPAAVNQAPRTWTRWGSNDGGTTKTTLDTQSNQTGWGANERRVFTIPAANRGAYTTYGLTITANNGGTSVAIGTLESLPLVSGALDLRSVAFPAQAVPLKGSIFFLAKATMGSITANTNLVASLSRNGGTNYTTGTLTSTGTLASGYTVYEANGFDISGQPSGSSMKWRLQTVGTALGVEVDAIVAQWG